jgi:hypothetical protein
MSVRATHWVLSTYLSVATGVALEISHKSKMWWNAFKNEPYAFSDRQLRPGPDRDIWAPRAG